MRTQRRPVASGAIYFGFRFNGRFSLCLAPSNFSSLERFCARVQRTGREYSLPGERRRVRRCEFSLSLQDCSLTLSSCLSKAKRKTNQWKKRSKWWTQTQRKQDTSLPQFPNPTWKFLPTLPILRLSVEVVMKIHMYQIYSATSSLSSVRKAALRWKWIKPFRFGFYSGISLRS